jgi:hypothetical protein
VVADTVYGHSADLRRWLEAQGFSFALAVPDHEVVCVDTALGYRVGKVANIEHLLPDGTMDWQRLSMSQGIKGERLFDWAIVPQVHHTIIDGRHFLVIRRCLDAPYKQTYYFVFAPPQISLQTIVLACQRQLTFGSVAFCVMDELKPHAVLAIGGDQTWLVHTFGA